MVSVDILCRGFLFVSNEYKSISLYYLADQPVLYICYFCRSTKDVIIKVYLLMIVLLVEFNLSQNASYTSVIIVIFICITTACNKFWSHQL